MFADKSIVFVLLIVLVGALGTVYASDADQLYLSPTPGSVSISSPTPLATIGIVRTPTPTVTPTEEGSPQLEAKESAGAVNVRAEADPEATKVGVIRYGERYTVTGRYYRWYQIHFEPSPSRRAYVFEELVNIIGDEALIPDLTQVLVATADNSIPNATASWEAIQQTPGGELTATAAVRAIDAPSDSEEMQTAVGVLPTFTYPPNITPQAPTMISDVETQTADDPGIVVAVSDGIAPIVPIAVLGLSGIFGLLISLIFRRR